MNTFLFIEQSPNPLAVKFVFKEFFLEKGDLILYKASQTNPEWSEPFWRLDYLQQIYIAQNFVVFIHEPTEKKQDSHVSVWADKTHELQNLLVHIPFPLRFESLNKTEENTALSAIQGWLDTLIRKATWIHGGNFQAISIEKGVLFLRPEGACYQCPYLGITLNKGILEPLQKQFPEIQTIQLSYDFI